MELRGELTENLEGDENAEEIAEFRESSEIKFAINNYDDIFSDFDPRPILQKGFSEDFLEEARRASLVKDAEKIDFIFTIPKKERDLKKEAKISERLKKYFKKHYEILKKEKEKIVNQGTWFVITGILIMFAATFLIFTYENNTFITSFFTVLLEPAGWWLFWEGCQLIVFDAKTKNPNIEFHKRMASTTIRFVSV